MSAFNAMKMAASVVMFVTYKDGNIRTYYSRDIERQKDNTYYWMTHLQSLCYKKWVGMVKEYAIYRCLNGKQVGDALIKEKYGDV